ncbi:MAG: TetR family transcriptional regulator [Acidimicrobiia bacterium]|nr:TetR family transcriptional regulator [Acidimicrobiia bacterium]
MVGEAEDKGPPARKKRLPLVTPEQAVQAAYDLVAAEGPAGLSMRKLAAALHVSLPTVYTAIHNKERLISQIQDRLFTDITEAVQADAGPDARDQLLAMGRALFAWADEHPRLAEFLLAEDASAETSARAAGTASEPGRSVVRQLVTDLLGEAGAAKVDPVTGVLFATAISRALLGLARSRRPVERDLWLQVWADTITDGLHRLAQPDAVGSRRRAR